MKKIAYIWIVVFLFSALAGAAEIYKWVDEKGVTHYSDVPPPAKKDEKIETVKEEKGVSKIGAPIIPPTKTQPPTTTTPATTPSPSQVDAWVDEYGNKHPITPELIAQETTRLEERLHYYEYDCKDDYKGMGSGNSAFDMQIKDRHRQQCEDSAKSVKQDLKNLAASPQAYFYNKYVHEKQRPQREMKQAEMDAAAAEQRAREAEDRARDAEQKARDAELGIP